MWPAADTEVLAALHRSYAEGTWGRYSGPALARLEEELATWSEGRAPMLVGSGTFAVELALRALKVGAGDEVLLSAYDFPGNFLAVHALGAAPVLVDIEPTTWQMDPGALAESISTRCRAILASHLHGGFAPMAAIMNLARRRGLGVVEDAAQCPGATLDGRRAGTWGDIGVFSFGGSKLLTAGRGGALLFSTTELQQRARLLQMRGNLVCPLSELQAAVLLPQLQKLDARNRERRDRVIELGGLLSGLPGLALFALPAGDHMPAYYKVGMRLEAAAFGLGRALLVRAVRAEGIALDEGFAALHMGRSRRRYRSAAPLQEAERAHHGCVVLHHPILLEGTGGVAQVARAIHKVRHQREALLKTEPT